MASWLCGWIHLHFHWNTTWFQNKHHLHAYTYTASPNSAHSAPSGSIQFPVVCLNGKNGKRKNVKKKNWNKIHNIKQAKEKHEAPKAIYVLYSYLYDTTLYLFLLCHKYEFQKKRRNIKHAEETKPNTHPFSGSQSQAQAKLKAKHRTTEPNATEGGQSCRRRTESRWKECVLMLAIAKAERSMPDWLTEWLACWLLYIKVNWECVADAVDGKE